ncbi:unnamed protein product [Chilo suppressalis]|uniref:Uncharacterized protein n=1 Tax=Chilo suppressalis TaxID=168631 RepID=A0ABN8B3B5_CHISP|nr:unnamed protein product [Chilo suppressalis]
MVVYIIVEYIFISIICSVIFLIVTVIGVRLWVEPIKAKCKCKTKLNGKVALITGGNTGIGLETARGLAKRGAQVIIASRNEQRSKQAVTDIIRTTGNPKVEYRHLDLSKFWSIRKFAEDFNKAFDRLDFLVNNSGALGLKEDLNEYGIDTVTQTNYLGPFLLTNLLLEKMLHSKPSRIVIVSSYAQKLHRFDINDIVGNRKLGVYIKYSNTKVYDVMWTKALAKRLPEGVTANCLHPGGNIGIGLETARGLAKRGAHVIIASRNEERSKQAVSDIIRTTGNPKVEYRHLDLSKFWSIRKFAEDFNKAFDRLDFLVNNSGAAGLKEDLNEYGIDPVTQINYLGPFLLTNLLLEKLIRSQPSRIVIVSSYAHKLHSFNINDIVGKRKLGIWKKYCNTKVYDVMWTKALAKRLPEGVTANCLHPGIVKTDIFHRLPKRMKDFLLSVISLMFKTPEEGAQTSIHLCVAPELAKVTGKYFSDCEISDPARITKKEEIVDQLWEESMLLVENKF